jgi:hypothetical protein
MENGQVVDQVALIPPEERINGLEKHFLTWLLIQ